MTEPEAWQAFVSGAMAWAEHLGHVERIKFQTPEGYVYVSISRATNKPRAFDEIDQDGDVIGREKAA
jgi:hypothetical protein